MRGISARSVRRFCGRQGTSRPTIRDSDATLDRIVNMHIQALGHSYGRRTMQCILRSGGITVGEHRVGQGVSRISQ